MKRGGLELIVGLFVLAGLACLAYLAIHLGKLEVIGKGYQVYALFDNISGLKTGATVEVAGVQVGRVESINLTAEYQAKVGLSLEKRLKVHDDAFASVRTRGVIGDKFIKLSPGNSENLLPPGGRIVNTESSIDLEELISSYIHGKV
jgi:phospholipid/cholesterol/gamma-HCH transport system substrate-binding protein